jgi:glucose/mannose-6-phosphate isomerase
MKALVEQFNAQMRDAIRIGQASQLQVPQRTYRNIVIAGMGGSGIGASVVASILFDKLLVPVTVVKTYSIPAFVNEDTLFIACSFSGNTEETLAAVEQAQAQNATIVGIMTGGKLKEIATQHNYPHLLFPGESKQPRANIGYSVFLLFFMLEAAGLIDGSYLPDLQETVALCEQNEEGMRKQAQELAQVLHGRLPIVYADALLESTAVRFQQQVNENSKQLCHVNSFPEMNHNEIVGWEHPKALLGQTAVLLLHSGFDHPRVRQRMDLCRPVFEEQGATVLDINAEGRSLTAQIFYLTHLLDWCSVYLAEANGADPAPVAVINRLKEQLAALPA